MFLKKHFKIICDSQVLCINIQECKDNKKSTFVIWTDEINNDKREMLNKTGTNFVFRQNSELK